MSAHTSWSSTTNGRSVNLTETTSASTLRDRYRKSFTALPSTPLAQTLRGTTNPSQPYHCDGFFGPAAWSARLTSCEVLSGPEWDEVSDHNPVLAEFACLRRLKLSK
jgi:endonuclease/exonuclease/phosphatase family metal-dependent hydrolase